MDKVILLNKHLMKFKYIERTNDEYIDGIFVPGQEVEKEFRGVPVPVGYKVLKLYPEGALTTEDICIYTKEDLSNINGDIIRVSNNKKYRLFDKKAYLELADLKVYIMKAVDNDG